MINRSQIPFGIFVRVTSECIELKMEYYQSVFKHNCFHLSKRWLRTLHLSCVCSPKIPDPSGVSLSGSGLRHLRNMLPD